jgi:DNA-binding MarR family transcriptional regulator
VLWWVGVVQPSQLVLIGTILFLPEQIVKYNAPVSSPPVSSPQNLHTWLSVVYTYERARHVLATKLSSLGLTLAQFDVLAGLANGDGITQQALTERLLASKGNLSGILDRLEANGSIRREPDPKDRRANIVVLTTAGQNIIKRALEIQDQLIDATVGQLKNNDAKQLKSIMLELRAQLDQLGQEQ